MSTDIALRELDWYLRDHLFRQSNVGKTVFRRESLPSEMVTLYLRYRGADLKHLSDSLIPVIDGLLAKKVLEQNDNELRLLGNLTRFQCANTKCFYINYLSKSEPRTCLRCQNSELNDFPKKNKKKA